MVSRILNYKFTQLALSTLIIMGALFCIFTPNYFLFKMGAKFAGIIMLGYLGLGFVFLIANQTKLMFTSLICCAGLCIFLKNSSNSAFHHPIQTSEAIIKVAHFNISASDEDYDGTIDVILNTEADLISIQEVTPDWHYLLEEKLKEKYPYSNTVVRFDPFGIAVYSKLPFSSIDTFYHEEIPNLMGSIQIGESNQDFHFISSHTMPPLYSSAYDNMKNHILKIAEKAQSVSAPIMTFGELNAPPWWQEIKDLREKAGLHDSRRSASYGFSEIFQNPVDYIFYSNHFECVGFENINGNSSSHLGISGTYQFNALPSDVE